MRHYPGGRWLEIDAREVELTVPLGLQMAPAIDQIARPTMRMLKPPLAITASTLKANTTPEAIVGAPGELILGHVTPAP